MEPLELELARLAKLAQKSYSVALCCGFVVCFLFSAVAAYSRLTIGQSVIAAILGFLSGYGLFCFLTDLYVLSLLKGAKED